MEGVTKQDLIEALAAFEDRLNAKLNKLETNLKAYTDNAVSNVITDVSEQIIALANMVSADFVKVNERLDRSEQSMSRMVTSITDTVRRPEFDQLELRVTRLER